MLRRSRQLRWLFPTRRLSDIRDSKKQSVPAGGVAPLLRALPNLKDLTVYLHKPPEVSDIDFQMHAKSRACASRQVAELQVVHACVRLQGKDTNMLWI